MSPDAEAEELENRRVLIDAVRAHPGVHMRELQRRTGMPTGLLRFHLEVLERNGELSSQKDRYYRRYYPGKTLTGDERRILSALRQSNPRRIILVLMDRGRVSHKELMVGTGFKPSTLSFYLKDLLAKGVVVREKRGRVNWYSVEEKELVVQVLRSYRPSFLDTLVDRFLETWFS